MVQSHQFNCKVESSILPPMESRVRKRMRVMGKEVRKRIEQCVKGVLPI